MEFFRRVVDPWGRNILIGISWDLLLAAAVAGAAFVVVHAVYVRFLAKEEAGTAEQVLARLEQGVPRRIVRHTLATRLSHWVLAAAVLVLLVTAFVPILGLKFAWVTIHWIAGLVLVAYTIFHTVHAAAKHSMRSMWMRTEDLRETLQRLRHSLGQGVPEPAKPGKWAPENKAFHHLTALAGLAVVLTGLLMMLRIPTPFWEANPYLLSDTVWGVIFVFHGLASVGFVGLIMAHIYFAVRPEKLWITGSMIVGWISSRNYVRHHDPMRWPERRPLAEAGEEFVPSVHARTDR